MNVSLLAYQLFLQGKGGVWACESIKTFKYLLVNLETLACLVEKKKLALALPDTVFFMLALNFIHIPAQKVI